MALLYNSSSAVCCPDQRRSVVSCPQSRSCDLSLHALIHVLTLTFLKSRRKGKALDDIITNYYFRTHFIYLSAIIKLLLSSDLCLQFVKIAGYSYNWESRQWPGLSHRLGWCGLEKLSAGHSAIPHVDTRAASVCRDSRVWAWVWHVTSCVTPPSSQRHNTGEAMGADIETWRPFLT